MRLEVRSEMPCPVADPYRLSGGRRAIIRALIRSGSGPALFALNSRSFRAHFALMSPARSEREAAMSRLTLPPEVEAVLRAFRTCEFTTLARDGTPITWPTLPFYDAERGCFLVTTSVGLPQKAFNVRRDGRVSLLFSDPTGSGLHAPPAVLVRGDAKAPDTIHGEITGFEEALREVYERQPASMAFSRNWLMRKLFDWYYMRLLIWVTPRQVLWWPAGDFSRAPREIEVVHVG